MKHILLLVLTFFATASAWAQSAEEISQIDPLYYYELYRPYPVERIADNTPAPKGYKPFYISHLGRHGSRWNVLRRLYDEPLALFAEAHRAGELTATGERFYADWQRIAADAQGRYGDLSPLGAEEHRGIANRMYHSYPEVFTTHKGKPAHIDCRSTTVPRCILSMASFAGELARLAPEADIAMEASAANAHYLAAFADLNSIKDEAKPLSDSVRRANMPDQQRFIRSLFRDGSRMAASIKDTNDFMYDMYLANAILAATPHTGILTLEYLFTTNELAVLWRCSNMRRYILTGPSAHFVDAVRGGAKPLVRNIIESADRAIATGDEQATLRFGHDVTIIPLVNLLGIECGSTVTDDYATIGYKWQVDVVTPMASNVQMVFFRNKAGDVLVKVLFCEREQRLDKAVGEPVNGCYYHWKDIRNYLEKKL